MTAEAGLEVMAPEPTRTVLRKAGRLGNVRYVTKPTSGKGVRRLAVARLADLDERPEELRALSSSPSLLEAPLVFLAVGRPHLSVSGLQLLTQLVRKGASRQSDPFISTDIETLRRVIAAHAMGGERELIASASVQDGVLSVWSCEPRLYQCAVADIPALARLTAAEVEALKVSRTGSRLHWDDGDVDLDLDAIRQYADPEVRKEAESKYRADAVRYGMAIRKLREQRGLRQNQIPGLSDREVRRLEQGVVLPHAETLKKLAAAHACTVDEYMSALAALSKQRPPGRKR
jgi:hypothetical protein